MSEGERAKTELVERVRVVEGDITLSEVDAIVNAANTTLLGGGGVDGAIHRAAGPGLLEECRALGGCPTGEARLTRGHKLRARFVIHTVGPVWKGGVEGEHELLERCYRASLSIAAMEGLGSIAFPAISTGAYGFPQVDAARIATSTVVAWVRARPLPETIQLVCFGQKSLGLHQEALLRAVRS
ncbi:MAG TPA: O-acetyl-ADP-ribose deacetylase [Polyangiaceae bacterium]|nr:O-acetyl-ADP-ribose deacetylase [Polyangiaceae bacterium]